MMTLAELVPRSPNQHSVTGAGAGAGTGGASFILGTYQSPRICFIVPATEICEKRI